ncbi:TetR family transcriptional regulator [Rhizobium rhizosphaerae]|uniref:TetR family transcriptional regulator n=1 Tax=Xaviernesmea rhizosphaerae TaxID=1672749 RepID=A0A1Q9AP49_9HYPH|nr:class I SAM-dependent methyltransferase [Xaviernesmea rhizosphaerae]OLP57183.1 TetR family transcriptional regulator [Xaviernesmea rhizosphaerae]OQP87711.1 TetR family transcriptional regulator [Xaviernesmea rhizosphaerae]
MPTPLARKIANLIRTNGPISVTDYFSLCLADPEFGYYKTREPFGLQGDFITAPEISQLFGEMIGIFLIEVWQRHGTPEDVHLVEIGPGRGTMMADILRVIARLAPELFERLDVQLVETSERLRKVQAQTLIENKFKVTWHDSFESLPEGFTLLVANELFDAIPIRQFVKTATGFKERLVGLDSEDRLTFAAGIATLDPALLPSPAQNVPLGTIFEIAPARDAVMQALCTRLRDNGGTALIIDYGHLATSFGDTLQAVRDHSYDPPLAHPGEADITSHVDFEQLARRAVTEGLTVNGMGHQGDFLLALGLSERAGALGRDKDSGVQDGIRQDVERLVGVGEGKMGELFKVLAVSYPKVPIPPFRNRD